MKYIYMKYRIVEVTWTKLMVGYTIPYGIVNGTLVERNNCCDYLSW